MSKVKTTKKKTTKKKTTKKNKGFEFKLQSTPFSTQQTYDIAIGSAFLMLAIGAKPVKTYAGDREGIIVSSSLVLDLIGNIATFKTFQRVIIRWEKAGCLERIGYQYLGSGTNPYTVYTCNFEKMNQMLLEYSGVDILEQYDETFATKLFKERYAEKKAEREAKAILDTIGELTTERRGLSAKIKDTRNTLYYNPSSRTKEERDALRHKIEILKEQRSAVWAKIRRLRGDIKHLEVNMPRKLRALCKPIKQIYSYAINHYRISYKFLTRGNKRLTNDLCHTRNEDSGDGARIALLKKHMTNGKNVVAFDVNASIYRLAYNLMHDEFLDHDVDFYEFAFNQIVGDRFNGDFKAVRKYWKQLFMPIYMRPQTHIFTTQSYNFLKGFDDIYDRDERELVELYSSVENLLGMEIGEVKKGIFEFLKNTVNRYKEYIFIHESLLHILMLDYFQNTMGIKAINVYDCFYFVEGTMTQEKFNEAYDKATHRYKTEFKEISSTETFPKK